MKSLKTLLKTTLATTAACVLSVSAHANLIQNGGFENPNFGGTTWTWYTSSAVDGWDGSNIELWKSGFGGVNSYEGNQHAELNAHPSNNQPFSIFQSFGSDVGQSYDVSFAYRARANNDEVFRFEIDGILNQLISDHVTTGWSVFNASFVAVSSLSTIRFTSVNPLTGTVGNFLDDVQVLASPTPVSEPATLALLGLGLLGLGISRRKLKNA